MKSIMAVALCLFMATNALAADNSYKVVYDGGSVSGIKAGTKGEIFSEAKQIRLTQQGKDC